MTLSIQMLLWAGTPGWLTVWTSRGTGSPCPLPRSPRPSKRRENPSAVLEIDSGCESHLAKPNTKYLGSQVLRALARLHCHTLSITSNQEERGTIQIKQNAVDIPRKGIYKIVLPSFLLLFSSGKTDHYRSWRSLHTHFKKHGGSHTGLHRGSSEERNVAN